MKNFLDKDFLLDNGISKHLYHTYGANLPIIDYHCHISPEEIAGNKAYKNITQIWLYGDHYKWRAMRASGIDEKYITGNATDYEKFEKWVSIMPNLIGNPLYHWSCLELKNYFGYEGIINSDNAQNIWNICNEKLSKVSCKDIISNSNVEVICTTDDPIDSLKWHKKIKEDNFGTSVLPAFRPDKLLSIEKEDFKDYITSLSKVSNIDIIDIASLKKAIVNRLNFFDSMGCKISDHGLPYVMYNPCSEEEANKIIKKTFDGEFLSLNEIMKYKTFCLSFLAENYNKLNWVMQLHFGVVRNINAVSFNNLGVDTGFDAIGDSSPLSQLGYFLNNLYRKNSLPKTIIYSLNPNDNEAINSIIGCFQGGKPLGRVQHGAAWWFNDHKNGIIRQLTSLASMGTLGNFVGMLTDSRSFLSYTRHEYFRRIFCNMIGTLVENGEYPNDETALKNIIENVCYYNAKEFLNLNNK